MKPADVEVRLLAFFEINERSSYRTRLRSCASVRQAFRRLLRQFVSHCDIILRQTRTARSMGQPARILFTRTRLPQERLIKVSCTVLLRWLQGFMPAPVSLRWIERLRAGPRRFDRHCADGRRHASADRRSVHAAVSDSVDGRVCRAACCSACARFRLRSRGRSSAAIWCRRRSASPFSACSRCALRVSAIGRGRADPPCSTGRRSTCLGYDFVLAPVLIQSAALLSAAIVFLMR